MVNVVGADDSKYKFRARLKEELTSKLTGTVRKRFVFTVEVVLYCRTDSTPDLLAVTEEDTTRIDNWVNECELGKRVSYNMWKLNNNEAVTMFLLKWNT